MRANRGCVWLTVWLLVLTAVPNLSVCLKLIHDADPVIDFTYELVSKHFSDCYIMKVRKPGSSAFANMALKIPVIDINMDEVDHVRTFTHFREAPRHSLTIKHQRQCIVYYISLSRFNTVNSEDLLRDLNIGTLQTEATYSYLIISEFTNYNLAMDFITSSALKSFQHRIWIKLVHENESASDLKPLAQFLLNIFCYFCFEGKPGFISQDRIYNSTEDIRSLKDIFPDVTNDFNGKIMRVVAPPAPPLVLITPSKTDTGKNEIQGQHAKILISIAKQFNFTYSLYSSPGGLTGIKLPNGTWNGIMGEIFYDRADIGLSVATSFERYQIVDTTSSVFYAFIVLVSTKPKAVFEWEAIFYPFKTKCWMAFIGSTIFTFLASKWLHNNAIRYEIPATMKGKPKADILSKLNSEYMTNYKAFYVTVGQLLEQGTPFDFNSIPSRMYVLFWMFFAMITTTAYRSKLFTFLTFPRVETPPGTFAELAESTYQWGMKHLGGIAFVFITKSPLSYIRYIGEKMDIYNDKYTCLDRTFKDRFTCIIYKAYIDYMMEVRYWKIRHNFYISDFVSPPVGSSWVLPKHAPWLPAFDKIVYPIYEMGLADKYLIDYQVSSAKALRDKAIATNSTADIFDLNSNFQGDDDGPKPLVMDNLYAAFFILAFGLIIGGAIVVMEGIQQKHKNLREKRDKFKMHVRNQIKQRKLLALSQGSQKLTFHQVVTLILPTASTNDMKVKGHRREPI